MSESTDLDLEQIYPTLAVGSRRLARTAQAARRGAEEVEMCSTGMDVDV